VCAWMGAVVGGVFEWEGAGHRHCVSHRVLNVDCRTRASRSARLRAEFCDHQVSVVSEEKNSLGWEERRTREGSS